MRLAIRCVTARNALGWKLSIRGDYPGGGRLASPFARQPKEIGYFVPADPLTRNGPKPSRLVAQSEDVIVDRRGYIYLSDKNHGIHILHLKQAWPFAA